MLPRRRQLGAQLVQKCHSLWDSETKPQSQALRTAGSARSECPGAAGDPRTFPCTQRSSGRSAAQRSAAQTVLCVRRGGTCEPGQAEQESWPEKDMRKHWVCFFFRCL